MAFKNRDVQKNLWNKIFEVLKTSKVSRQKLYLKNYSVFNGPLQREKFFLNAFPKRLWARNILEKHTVNISTSNKPHKINPFGNSYYATEQKLTVENAEAVVRCIQKNGVRVVKRLVEISPAGRAPKNDPALFVLALCSKFGDLETKHTAWDVKLSLQ